MEKLFDEIIIPEKGISKKVYGNIKFSKNPYGKENREAKFSCSRTKSVSLVTKAPSLGFLTIIKFDGHEIYCGNAVISITDSGGKIFFDPEI